MTVKYEIQFPLDKQLIIPNSPGGEPGGFSTVGCDTLGRYHLKSNNDDRKEDTRNIIAQYPDVCLIDQYNKDGQFIASYDVKLGQWSDE